MHAETGGFNPEAESKKDPIKQRLEKARKNRNLRELGRAVELTAKFNSAVDNIEKQDANLQYGDYKARAESGGGAIEMLSNIKADFDRAQEVIEELQDPIMLKKSAVEETMRLIEVSEKLGRNDDVSELMKDLTQQTVDLAHLNSKFTQAQLEQQEATKGFMSLIDTYTKNKQGV